MFPKRRALSAFLSLVFCAAVSADSSHLLPGDVTLNDDAGRGGYLIVKLRLATGDESPFIVDSGSPITVCDKSLEPQLGRRLGSITILSPAGDRQTAGRFAMPKLFLGATELITGDTIFARDFGQSSGSDPRVMGILGTDCLRHYCIQLDFEARKMRFLNPADLNAAALGKPFPLEWKGGYPFINQPGLDGNGSKLMIDLGCRVDGLVDQTSINALAELLPECIWDNERYTNLILGAPSHANSIGLNFLARHLVTINFPQKIMYLKKVRPEPIDGTMRASRLGAPMEFLQSLKDQGTLPGIAKDAKGLFCIEKDSDAGADSATVEFRGENVPPVHYLVSRASATDPWKVERTWQTDQPNPSKAK